jgi:hypothetical protein
MAAAIVTREVQLRPIAGREHHGLTSIRQFEREGGSAGRVDCDALPQLDGRLAV